MTARRTPAHRAPTTSVFAPTARHLWLASLGLLAAARRLVSRRATKRTAR